MENTMLGFGERIETKEFDNLEPGNYNLRLVGILILGSMYSERYDNYSAKTAFRFETLEDGEVFSKDKGKQPYNISKTTYKNKTADFMEELADGNKDLLVDPSNPNFGYNPLKLIGKVFKVRLDNVTKDKKTYTNIVKVKDMLDADDAAEIIATASKDMELNDLKIFHPTHDVDMLADTPSDWKPFSDINELVKSPIFISLPAHFQSEIAKSKEFIALDVDNLFEPSDFKK